MGGSVPQTSHAGTMATTRRIGALVLLAVLTSACSSADATVTTERSSAPTTTEAPTTTAATPPETTTTVVPVTAAATTSTPATTAPPTTLAPTTSRPFIERVVVDTRFSPYARIGDLVLLHPAAFIERIGFHEASHDGARQQDATETTARPVTMETRERGTPDRTAADIVVQPETEIRAPVSGVVVRGGGYTLYCDHRDEYVVIEPDGYPGWELKIFHIVGVQVGVGQRVEAGVTPIAAHSRALPFESQVDELTAEPSWPHVHVEVVDTSIPDKPNPGGGGGCS